MDKGRVAARIRGADEIDRGQQSGELAQRQDNLRQNTEVQTSDIGNPATYEDLGIDRRRDTYGG